MAFTLGGNSMACAGSVGGEWVIGASKTVTCPSSASLRATTMAQGRSLPPSMRPHLASSRQR
jgi:hypothetical protein